MHGFARPLNSEKVEVRSFLSTQVCYTQFVITDLFEDVWSTRQGGETGLLGESGEEIAARIAGSSQQTGKTSLQ